MGRSGRRKRRRQRTGRAVAGTTAVEPVARGNWFRRQGGGVQTLVVLGGIALLVVGHVLLWGTVFPAVGAVVGPVPVVSTVTGWLFGGGAFLAWGVYAVNHDTAKPEAVRRLRTVAWVWSAVAALCVPTGYADGISLPVDFWAGVYAGAYGVVAAPLAVGVVALGWWLLVTKLARRRGEPSHQAIGWICVGYAVLLLVWGSTLLRL
ncbi:hypothetical protein ACIGNX_21110 [Actinosynnema sp. NPDC053489]|uniref:hypothetical protein n=1 Tax=Actinosynnema sp. NPDC053489 TaxID=3363916 RepID=UPI0037C8D93B